MDWENGELPVTPKGSANVSDLLSENQQTTNTVIAHEQAAVVSENAGNTPPNQEYNQISTAGGGVGNSKPHRGRRYSVLSIDAGAVSDDSSQDLSDDDHDHAGHAMLHLNGTHADHIHGAGGTAAATATSSDPQSSHGTDHHNVGVDLRDPLNGLPVSSLFCMHTPVDLPAGMAPMSSERLMANDIPLLVRALRSPRRGQLVSSSKYVHAIVDTVLIGLTQTNALHPPEMALLWLTSEIASDAGGLLALLGLSDEISNARAAQSQTDTCSEIDCIDEHQGKVQNRKVFPAAPQESTGGAAEGPDGVDKLSLGRGRSSTFGSMSPPAVSMSTVQQPIEREHESHMVHHAESHLLCPALDALVTVITTSSTPEAREASAVALATIAGHHVGWVHVIDCSKAVSAAIHLLYTWARPVWVAGGGADRKGAITRLRAASRLVLRLFGCRGGVLALQREPEAMLLVQNLLEAMIRLSTCRTGDVAAVAHVVYVIGELTVTPEGRREIIAAQTSPKFSKLNGLVPVLTELLEVNTARGAFPKPGVEDYYSGACFGACAQHAAWALAGLAQEEGIARQLQAQGGAAPLLMDLMDSSSKRTRRVATQALAMIQTPVAFANRQFCSKQKCAVCRQSWADLRTDHGRNGASGVASSTGFTLPSAAGSSGTSGLARTGTSTSVNTLGTSATGAGRSSDTTAAGGGSRVARTQSMLGRSRRRGGGSVASERTMQHQPTDAFGEVVMSGSVAKFVRIPGYMRECQAVRRKLVERSGGHDVAPFLGALSFGRGLVHGSDGAVGDYTATGYESPGLPLSPPATGGAAWGGVRDIPSTIDNAELERRLDVFLEWERDNAHRVRTLLEEVWNVEQPGLVISVVGSQQPLSMPEALSREFMVGLMRIATTTEAWVLTSGVGPGVSRLVGEARSRYGEKVPLIGVSSWGLVRDRKRLKGRGDVPLAYRTESGTSGVAGAGGGAATGSAHEGDVALDPHHTHFVLVDDGSRGHSGAEPFLRSSLESCLSVSKAARTVNRAAASVVSRSKGIDGEDDDELLDEEWLPPGCGHEGLDSTTDATRVPLLMVVVGGGPAVLYSVLSACRDGSPIVVLKQSGNAAAILSLAIAHFRTTPDSASMAGSAVPSNLCPCGTPKLNCPLLWQECEHWNTRLGLQRPWNRADLAPAIDIAESDAVVLSFRLTNEMLQLSEPGAVLEEVLTDAVLAGVTDPVHRLRLSILLNRVGTPLHEITTLLPPQVLQMALDDALISSLLLDRVYFVEELLRIGADISIFDTTPRHGGMGNDESLPGQLTAADRLETLWAVMEQKPELSFVVYLLQEKAKEIADSQDANTSPSRNTKRVFRAEVRDALVDSMMGTMYRHRSATDGPDPDLGVYGELILWAGMANRPGLARLFWSKIRMPLRAALFMANLLRCLSKMWAVPSEVRPHLKANAAIFEELALSMVTGCFERSHGDTAKLLALQWPRWPGRTNLDVIFTARCERLVLHESVAESLEARWRKGLAPAREGGMSHGTGLLGVIWILLAIILPYPLALFARLDPTCVREERAMLAYEAAARGSAVYLGTLANFFRLADLRVFYRSVIVRFWTHALSHTVFLFLLTNVATSREDATFAPSWSSAVNAIVNVWVAALIVEECTRIARLKVTAATSSYINRGTQNDDNTSPLSASTSAVSGRTSARTEAGSTHVHPSPLTAAESDPIRRRMSSHMSQITEETTPRGTPNSSHLGTESASSTTGTGTGTNVSDNAAFAAERSNQAMRWLRRAGGVIRSMVFGLPASKRRRRWFRLAWNKPYLRSKWSRADVLMLVAYVMAAGIRTSANGDDAWARCFLASSLFIGYVRLFSFFGVNRSVGPLLVTIEHMLVDVGTWLIIYLTITAGFGFSMQVTSMSPGEEGGAGFRWFTRDGDDIDEPITFLAKLIHTYWMMFSVATFTEFTNPSPLHFFQLVLFVLVSNVILLSLLIAMLSSTYEAFRAKARVSWMYLRYQNLNMHLERSAVPPPLTLLLRAAAVISWCVPALYGIVTCSFIEASDADSRGSNDENKSARHAMNSDTASMSGRSDSLSRVLSGASGSGLPGSPGGLSLAASPSINLGRSSSIRVSRRRERSLSPRPGMQSIAGHDVQTTMAFALFGHLDRLASNSVPLAQVVALFDKIPDRHLSRQMNKMLHPLWNRGVNGFVDKEAFQAAVIDASLSSDTLLRAEEVIRDLNRASDQAEANLGRLLALEAAAREDLLRLNAVDDIVADTTTTVLGSTSKTARERNALQAAGRQVHLKDHRGSSVFGSVDASSARTPIMSRVASGATGTGAAYSYDLRTAFSDRQSERDVSSVVSTPYPDDRGLTTPTMAMLDRQDSISARHWGRDRSNSITSASSGQRQSQQRGQHGLQQKSSRRRHEREQQREQQQRALAKMLFMRQPSTTNATAPSSGTPRQTPSIPSPSGDLRQVMHGSSGSLPALSRPPSFYLGQSTETRRVDMQQQHLAMSIGVGSVGMGSMAGSIVGPSSVVGDTQTLADDVNVPSSMMRQMSGGALSGGGGSAGSGARRGSQGSLASAGGAGGAGGTGDSDAGSIMSSSPPLVRVVSPTAARDRPWAAGSSRRRSSLVKEAVLGSIMSQQARSPTAPRAISPTSPAMQ